MQTHLSSIDFSHLRRSCDDQHQKETTKTKNNHPTNRKLITGLQRSSSLWCCDANLEDIRLQVFVKQEMESSPDQVVGRVVLGTKAEGLELQHWKEAMTSKKPIAQWHSLREYHPADQTITGVVSPTHKSVISKKKLARFFSTSSEDEG